MMGQQAGTKTFQSAATRPLNAHLCVILVICCFLTHAPPACTVKVLINACTTTHANRKTGTHLTSTDKPDGTHQQ
jgi:hypothetical protein